MKNREKRKLLTVLSILFGVCMMVGFTQRVEVKDSSVTIEGIPTNSAYIQTPNGTEVEVLQAQYDLTETQKSSCKSKYSYWENDNTMLSSHFSSLPLFFR